MDDNGGVELGEICTVNNLNKKYPDLALKAAMNYEYYYEKLKTKAQELEQSGMDSQDDHDKMSGNESATSQAKARQLVREAMAASTRAGDKISGDVRSLVSKLLGDEATWEQELRRFPQDAEVFSVSKDRRHRNRRFGYVYPGDKKERRVKLAVGFDLSGSITDDIKDRFVTELRHIYNSGAELVVLFFDTTVTAVKDFADADFSWKVPGGGGTLFQPVIDKAAELRVDGLIFLTDGECFDTIEEPAFPVLWGLLEGFEHRQAFGRPITVSMK
jgi:predicted metal-dependent peptidase